MFNLNYVLNDLTMSNCDYIFVDGKPIDNRRPKYKIWRRMFNSGQLKCKCCGSEVVKIKLVRCKDAGSIYKKTGDIKYTFKLFNDLNKEMTFDHWIPKSFLRKVKLDWKIKNNLVLMCKDCNKFKANMIPLYWQKQYIKMY